MPRVNPEIIVWARETAGLTVADAATRVGFSGSRRSSAADKLTAIEDGQREPTRSQLVRMSNTYRRPLLTFYLSRPPEKSDRGADFRTLSGETSAEDDALLDALLRDIRARQSMIRSILEDEDEAEALWFVGCTRCIGRAMGNSRVFTGTIGNRIARIPCSSHPYRWFCTITISC